MIWKLLGVSGCGLGWPFYFHSVKGMAIMAWLPPFGVLDVSSTSENWHEGVGPGAPEGPRGAIPSRKEYSTPFDFFCCVPLGVTHKAGGAPHLLPPHTSQIEFQRLTQLQVTKERLSSIATVTPTV